MESFLPLSLAPSSFFPSIRVYKIACKGDYEAWPEHVKLLSVTLTAGARCCEKIVLIWGLPRNMAWARGVSRTCRASHNSARCFARLQASRGDMYGGGKKEAPRIEESPGPFNTIRTSGYHHGLFDSPFCPTSRNVFFLLRLFSSSALLVPSIHPSLVRATRLFLPLMANRMCFWTRLNFAS